MIKLRHLIGEAVPKNPRVGRCYELSGRYVSVHPNSVLVHGTLKNPFRKGLSEIEHAWVEIGDEVFDPAMDMNWPKNVYEDFFHAQPKKKYSHDDVNRITDKTGNWGPWEDITEDLESQNAEHEDALKKTGFWGKAGAGALIMARTTGRLLIQLRADYVEQPNTWGVWGGAIDIGLSPESAMQKEIEQETGLKSSQIRETIPLYVFKHPSGFKYYNFLITVDDEFTPRPHTGSEWEINGFRWVKYGQWPSPLHFGLQFLLQHSGRKIQKIIYKNSKGEKLF
jgi:8-oxo-dGTP pyrophosphatase MutT (NUDIX family)